MPGTRQGMTRSSEGIPPASRPAIMGWVLFDWAAQPFFTLVTTFVYAPYFASAIASDPTEGQALWGYAKAAAGLAIAVFSPVLGAIADAAGRRKPWIAAFGALLVIGSWGLWFGAPGEGVALVLACFALASIGAEFATVFNNAMMHTLVPRTRLGRLSGTGWAAGYVGGLLSLVLVLGFLAANPQTGKTLIGITPLFGFDAAAREGDRAVLVRWHLCGRYVRLGDDRDRRVRHPTHDCRNDRSVRWREARRPRRPEACDPRQLGDPRRCRRRHPADRS
jgi:UMF1 family MFS transporter